MARIVKKLGTPALNARFYCHQVSSSYKVGVLYCKAGQVTEEDMYNNEHGSPAFQQFLDLLGTTVKLQGFDDFKGGLDVKSKLLVFYQLVLLTGTTGSFNHLVRNLQ